MDRPLRWEFPYPSQRAHVFARNVVASSQPLATQAGVEVLRKGGNAVDAALATAITLTVVEPCSNGVGSDLFAIVSDQKGLQGLNASGRSPRALNMQKFEGLESMPISGWDCVTVPGAVSGWVALSDRYGHLPFRDLFESAIQYAHDGFAVGSITARAWDLSIDRLGRYNGFRQHFLSDGRAPKTGELFKRPDLARTLSSIADTKGDSFYQGELASAIVAQSSREGGDFSVEDLRDHEIAWVNPIDQPYNDVRLHEIPPNGQGLAALIALGILQHLDTDSLKPNSADWVHLQAEAMKIAIRAAFDHISDPKYAQTSVEELLDPRSLKKAAETISNRASDLPPLSLPTSQDTVYLTAADKDGQMVSLIQSNYMGFGSGIVIEGTGISMQNRGAGFSLEKAHPNELAGNKRPFNTIIPGFVTKDEQASMSFGVMGGHMQHQGHVQMVTRIYDHGENPQSASDAPRWHLTKDFELILEAGYDPATARKLSDRGHNVSLSNNRDLFGGAQLIYRMEEGYCAASDHRKEGMAAGF
ncbi:MAG: gamma-glutamyltransferase family protein [Gammaproteobacteria bacterium]|nr:gamma-glutamyltransferase family protein [Gammaproteobacteria bacterium]